MIKNKLGNFVKIRTGKLDANASSIDGEYPFFTCSRVPLKISSFSYDCKCVLVAGNGDLNVKYYEGKFDAYQRTYIIESKDESILNTRYLYWFLFKYVEKLRELSIGGVIKYIKINNLTDPIIPLPSIEDQKRIVKILDEADALRQKRKQAIGLLDNYLKSVFLEMFGDPEKNTKDYPIYDLGEKLELITYGLTVRPKYIEDGIPLISAREIRSGNINYSTAPKISIIDFQKLTEKAKPRAGDILFSKTGSIGHCAIVDQNTIFAITQNAARLTFSHDINPIFALYYLRTPYIQRIANLSAKGNAVKDLQLGVMKKFKFVMPPIELQNKFSQIVVKKEVLKKSMLAQSTELETQFQALMQKAFKGEL